MIVDIIQYSIVALTFAAIAYVVALPWREQYTDYYVPTRSAREGLLILSMIIQIMTGLIIAGVSIVWAFAGVL